MILVPRPIDALTFDFVRMREIMALEGGPSGRLVERALGVPVRTVEDSWGSPAFWSSTFLNAAHALLPRDSLILSSANAPHQPSAGA